VAAARGRGKTEEGEREVDEGGPKYNFRKMQGPYCNASITFKPVLKWRWAQKQNVWFFKMYNFALRFILRRAKDLQLIRNSTRFLNFA
jgi:hypothetical protein